MTGDQLALDLDAWADGPQLLWHLGAPSARRECLWRPVETVVLVAGSVL